MKMQASRPCHHQLPITSTSCLKPGTGSGDHLCFSLFFYVLPVTVALNASHGCLFGCFIRHKSTSFGFKTRPKEGAIGETSPVLAAILSSLETLEKLGLNHPEIGGHRRWHALAQELEL